MFGFRALWSEDTSAALDAETRTRRTFRLDLARGVFRGILTSGTQTFGMFIAIRVFQAGDTSKALIGSAPFIGMLVSLLFVHYASKTGFRKSVLGSLPAAVCGVMLFAAAFADTLAAYTVCLVLAFMALTSLVPFLTAIYNDNYPEDRRGMYFSRSVLALVLVSVVAGFLGSAAMDADLDNYRWILATLGLAALGKACVVYAMPSGIIENGEHKNPLGNLKLVFEDRNFGYVLLTWFIMGFANLWTLPLRVDYITSSKYGIEGSALFVALIITVIPDLMRALSTPFLARLFDRMNFIVLRMILNLLFAIGVGLFFLTKDPYLIATASAFIGMAFGGGTIAWSLWVTKYAPPGKVAAYMSVHVGLTGVRGTIGPMIGFWMVNLVGPVNIGLISFSMMILATVMLIPEIKHGKRKRGPIPAEDFEPIEPK